MKTLNFVNPNLTGNFCQSQEAEAIFYGDNEIVISNLADFGYFSSQWGNFTGMNVVSDYDYFIHDYIDWIKEGKPDYFFETLSLKYDYLFYRVEKPSVESLLEFLRGCNEEEGRELAERHHINKSYGLLLDYVCDMVKRGNKKAYKFLSNN